MKKLFIFIIVVVASAVSFGCDSVHHKQSAVHIKSVSVFGDGKTDSETIKAIQQVDTSQDYCCDTSDGEVSREPFYDTTFQIKVENTLRQNVYFSYMYFVIKNFYGGGNDYVSPNLTISGDAFIEGSSKSDDDDEDDDDDDDTGWWTEEDDVTYGEGTIYAMYLPACPSGASGDRCLPFSSEVVNAVGIKNVIVYVHAYAENGDEIVTTGTVTVNMNDYNYCTSGTLITAPSYCTTLSGKSEEIIIEEDEESEEEDL